MTAQNPSICVLPILKGTGGPSSFLSKLKKGLASQGIDVHHDIRNPGTQALLVIGGTRRLGDLMYAKRKGIRIVQRLDGMNWLQKKVSTGLPHYIRSEWMNLVLSIIRRCLADAVVYQSAFTQSWWNREFGDTRVPNTVIHNGVDLKTFSPSHEKITQTASLRLLVVEGSFAGGHERDLQNAVGLANDYSRKTNKPVDLLIAGKVPRDYIETVNYLENVSIHWLGLVPHTEIPDLNRSAHLIFPAEINAACPNSLIEALACGLPAVGYATGSIPELIGKEGGIVVPYGTDHWMLETPDPTPLTKAIREILENWDSWSANARKRAERLFDVDDMVEKYRAVLLGDLGRLAA